MDDPKDENDAVVVEDVIHHAVVADSQPVEGVAHTLDRLDSLPADAARTRCTDGELLESLPDPVLLLGDELLEGSGRRRRQLDAVWLS